MNENDKKTIRNVFAFGLQRPPYGSNTDRSGRVEVNGISLYFEVYGQGHPLLLLHGNSGSIESFYKQIYPFSKHFQVIAIDSRAQGRSTDGDQDITYRLMAEDTAQLVRALGLGRVHVFGWSDGGNIALEMALHHRDLLEKIVVLSANFIPGPLAIFEQILDATQRARYSDLSDEDIRWRTRLSPHPERDPAIFEKMRKLLLNHPNLSLDQLRSLQTPALVMAADHDLIQELHTLKLFNTLPNSQLCVIPGTSHSALQEKPELVNQVVLDFLNTPFKPTDRFGYNEW